MSLPRLFSVRNILRVRLTPMVLLIALTLLSGASAASAQELTTYEQVAASDLPKRVLIEVLARNFRSKRYTDLVPLDGGTVGIANFARGGLAALYREMDTQKYFGRSGSEMIRQYSAACRPSGRSGNDTGWGCYSLRWWRDGMARFLASPESEDVQHRAWMSLMRPAITAATSHGWNTPRSLAIAMGIANSMGSGGFSSLAERHQWQPEVTLRAYTGRNAHRLRRLEALNATFPQ